MKIFPLFAYGYEISLEFHSHSSLNFLISSKLLCFFRHPNYIQLSYMPVPNFCSILLLPFS
jgi:hypothetical protein